MTQYYDISRPLFPGMVVWPGETEFQLEPTARLAKEDTVNVTRLTLGAHTGTHVDAPFHFTADGLPLEQVDVAPYWGPAQVVTVSKPSGPLTPDDFAGYDLRRAPRLLVHSALSEADHNVFHKEFVHPSPELADYLGQQGIILYGADGPSMDHPDNPNLPGHHALQRNGILILEGLDLTGVPDGLYELSALPLKIVAGDGCPVRAVLRSVDAAS